MVLLTLKRPKKKRKKNNKKKKGVRVWVGGLQWKTRRVEWVFRFIPLGSTQLDACRSNWARIRRAGVDSAEGS